jgi:hypothetical protein
VFKTAKTQGRRLIFVILKNDNIKKIIILKNNKTLNT